MKKTIFPILAVSLLTIGSGYALSQQDKMVEVNAYSVASLPTTIDLNDSTTEEVRSYYSGLNSLSEAERKGTNLLKNLKEILKNGQKYYSYDDNTKIWQMYEITDRDWEKSPASSTTYGTYNPSTNTITNYQYGTSNSNGKNNPYVHALYINRNIDNQTKAWGNHNQDAWGINQEHVWAKSHGFDTKGSNSTGGARGDPMHLIAGNGWANHEHSNYFYAFVDKNKSYSDAGSKYNTVYGNLTGKSKNTGGSETVFEPQDSDKGDIARAIFYMAARYNYYSGTDSDGIDGNNPNLVLLNNLSENSRTGTSSASSPFGMGLLSDLLAWNKLDPVDEYEIHRNNLLYKNYTNNRNPFIDFPEWADCIWGTADLDGTNYNPTVSRSASPASDPLHDEGFSVYPSELKLQVSETAKVKGNYADDDISWTVDDPTIVSISKNTSLNNEEITVTALKNGVTTIRASAYTDGDLINKTISVKVKELSGISISGMKTDFKVGDKFSTEGLKVTATYTDSTSEEITTGYTVSEPDMSKVGKQTITVTYKNKTATYEINIADKTFFEKYQLYIIIGGVAVVVVIGIIVFATGSKKTKRKMKSAVKKGAKSYAKKSSSNNKKK